jgi:ribosomal protein S18 acetylase RimI-like enzyme
MRDPKPEGETPGSPLEKSTRHSPGSGASPNSGNPQFRLPWAPQLSDENPVIEDLTPSNVHDLRLPWLSRFNHDDLIAYLQTHPGKALWVPGTGEYIVAERWRGRDDIANIVEVTARRGKARLVNTLVDRLREEGNHLVLLPSDIWNEHSRLYSDLDFGLIERIVFFERDLPTWDKRLRTTDDASDPKLPILDFSLATTTDLDLVLQLDQRSFPWLWWNARDDMAAYMQIAGVYVYIAKQDQAPVGYASFTMYNGWAHLDRLAVIQAQQGRGYGAAQLAYILRLMSDLGARSVGLSTQENNVRSHRLYRRFGFRQTRDTLGIYGKAIEEGRKRKDEG